MRALADLLAPPSCVSCGAVSDGELCRGCAAGVTLLLPPICARCGAPRPAGPCVACADLAGFTRARSLLAYGGPASRLVLALKRRGRPGLARDAGALLGGLALAHGIGAPDVVAFVPGGRSTRRLGYDHAELLARAVARELLRPVRRVLFRAAEGARQADVPLAARRDNARGRFAARPTSGRVLLVDDVFTTGATAEACSMALLRAGAERVDVLTLARTLRRRPGRGVMVPPEGADILPS